MSNISFFVVSVDSGLSIGTYLGCINLNNGLVNGCMYITDMVYERGIDTIKEFHYSNINEFIYTVEKLWGDDVSLSYDESEINSTFSFIEDILNSYRIFI